MFESDVASHVIAHISDTHLLGGNRKLFSTVDVASNLTRVLDRLRAGDQQIDALVFTGDLADIAEVDAYRWLRSQVEPVAAELGAELVWVMGNHDERLTFRASCSMMKAMPCRIASIALAASESLPSTRRFPDTITAQSPMLNWSGCRPNLERPRKTARSSRCTTPRSRHTIRSFE